MKILISSGGTKVAIDPVRDITNMSRGTFGSNIAREALIAGHEVIYFCAKDAVSPFTLKFNLYNFELTRNGCEEAFAELFGFFERYNQHYTEERFRTYQDYADGLKNLVEAHKPDAVVLAAAVSDFLCTNYSDAKERSDAAKVINLLPAPKVIRRVKQWRPETFLVGFKLFAGENILQVREALKHSFAINNCDLIITNELSEIKAGRHSIAIINKGEEDEPFFRVVTPERNPAREIVKEILARAQPK